MSLLVLEFKIVITVALSRKHFTDLEEYRLPHTVQAITIGISSFTVMWIPGGRPGNHELYLRSTTLNPIDCLSVGYFASVCTNGSSGFSLDISYCSIGDQGCKFLARGLSKCPRSHSELNLILKPLMLRSESTAPPGFDSSEVRMMSGRNLDQWTYSECHSSRPETKTTTEGQIDTPDWDKYDVTAPLHRSTYESCVLGSYDQTGSLYTCSVGGQVTRVDLVFAPHWLINSCSLASLSAGSLISIFTVSIRLPKNTRAFDRLLVSCTGILLPRRHSKQLWNSLPCTFQGPRSSEKQIVIVVMYGFLHPMVAHHPIRPWKKNWHSPNRRTVSIYSESSHTVPTLPHPAEWRRCLVESSWVYSNGYCEKLVQITRI